ncbi:hypothetical protein PTKIN_Ptkin06aG0010000 [Pterospermum kingtungense]
MFLLVGLKYAYCLQKSLSESGSCICSLCNTGVFSLFFHLLLCHQTHRHVELETAKTRPEEENPSKTAYVKFQLQKKCLFGDHIFVVGDHPMFGLWDPENAVPLTWSEGHVWSLELDIPVGVPIQFKFILKTRTGNLVWQPGPDRVFKSWETEKKIIICEDWEEAEYQKLLEEEPSANQDGTVLDSEMALVAENLTPPKESDPLQALAEELVTGTSAPSLEKQLALVAENISYSTEDLKANVNKGVPNYQKDEALATSSRNVLVSEGIGSVGRVETIQNPATADVEPNLVVYEGTPVLVPGLTPSATVSAEDEKNSTVDASVEVSEAECHKLSEVIA